MIMYKELHTYSFYEFSHVRVLKNRSREVLARLDIFYVHMLSHLSVKIADRLSGNGAELYMTLIMATKSAHLLWATRRSE